MRLGAPLALMFGGVALLGAVPHLSVLLVQRMGLQRFQELRMRRLLLPLLEPEEIVTCRPRSAIVPSGWMLTMLGMACIPLAALLFLGGLADVFSTGALSPFAKHGAVAGTFAYLAFVCLRIGGHALRFDCIVSDKRLYWCDGFWSAVPHSCRVQDVAQVTAQVIMLPRATLKMVSVAVNNGRTLRMYGLESEREFFEALGFEYPPPKGAFWKPASAQRRML